MTSENVALHTCLYNLHNDIYTQYLNKAHKNLTFAIYLAPAQSADRLRACCYVMEELVELSHLLTVATRPKEA